jgi:asparagine synthetase B (glutamine-hydrolysing)
MCGIFATLTGVRLSLGVVEAVEQAAAGEVGEEETESVAPPSLTPEEMLKCIARRGPDASGSLEMPLGVGAALHLGASVLHLRGAKDECTPQPAVDAEGNLLCFNGEVWGGLEVGEGCSDTLAVLQALTAARGGSSDDPAALVALLESIRGPFALIFWEQKSRTLWYARDKLGRRSLLAGRVSPTQLVLTSCAPGGAGGALWEEVSTTGVFRVRCPGDGEELGVVEHLPWSHALLPGVERLHASGVAASPQLRGCEVYTIRVHSHTHTYTPHT